MVTGERERESMVTGERERESQGIGVHIMWKGKWTCTWFC
jgi:hypothetical protein